MMSPAASDVCESEMFSTLVKVSDVGKVNAVLELSAMLNVSVPVPPDIESSAVRVAEVEVITALKVSAPVVPVRVSSDVVKSKDTGFARRS